MINSLRTFGVLLLEVAVLAGCGTGSHPKTDGTKPGSSTSASPATAQASVTVPKSITVPRLTGMDESAAVKMLVKDGLAVGPISSDASIQLAGTIAAQTPNPNTLAPAGTAVALVVSTGPASSPPPAGPVIPVPNVLGLDKTAAADALTQLGFVPTLKPEGDRVGDDNVLNQFPAPNTLIAKGGNVIVYYAVPFTSAVPNVVGTTSSQAVTVIQHAGFRVQIEGNAGPGAVVQSQSPPSGRTVNQGATITLTMN